MSRVITQAELIARGIRKPEPEKAPEPAQEKRQLPRPVQTHARPPVIDLKPVADAMERLGAMMAELSARQSESMLQIALTQAQKPRAEAWDLTVERDKFGRMTRVKARQVEGDE